MSLAELTDESLIHKVLQVERDLVSARFKHSMNQLENTASLRHMRREIARLRTETRRREAAEGLPKDALLQKHRTTFGGGADDSTESEAAEKGGFLSGIVDKLTSSE
ncbi:MAG: 50S ribosomal protein L29 [Myxococcales bacterium]|nr:50S ribosomal protein L29 [Myxococcales bacterium]